MINRQNQKHDAEYYQCARKHQPGPIDRLLPSFSGIRLMLMHCSA